MAVLANLKIKRAEENKSKQVIQVGGKNINTSVTKHVYPGVKHPLEGIPWDSIPPEVYRKGLTIVNINNNYYGGGSPANSKGSSLGTSSDDATSSSSESVVYFPGVNCIELEIPRKKKKTPKYTIPDETKPSSKKMQTKIFHEESNETV